MSDIERVVLLDGKYTVVIQDGCKVSALRHGKAWRGYEEFVGDSFILAMASQLIEQQEKLAHYEGFVDKVCNVSHRATMTALYDAIENLEEGLSHE